MATNQLTDLGLSGADSEPPASAGNGFSIDQIPYCQDLVVIILVFLLLELETCKPDQVVGATVERVRLEVTQLVRLLIVLNVVVSDFSGPIEYERAVINHTIVSSRVKPTEMHQCALYSWSDPYLDLINRTAKLFVEPV